MKSLKKYTKVIFALYTITVVVLSILPSFIFRNMPYFPTFSYADKVAHVLMYFFYMLITGIMMYANGKKRVIPFAILYTIFVGVLMEFCQMTISGVGRTGSMEDIIANTIGTIAGAILIKMIVNHKKRVLSTD
jgi:VanZ family protein